MDHLNHLDHLDSFSQWNKILVYGASLAGQMLFWLWGLSTLSTMR